MSGDFFDVLPVSPTAAGIIICDVMGHGVRSALITAMVRTMIEELRPHASGPALGLVDDHVYESASLELEIGDRLLFFTDGIVEAADEAGQEFGLPRLAAALERATGGNLGDRVGELRDEAARFAQGQGFGDDVCLVVCQLD